MKKNRCGGAGQPPHSIETGSFTVENSRIADTLTHISLACGQIMLGCDLAAINPAQFTAEDVGALCSAVREVLIASRMLEKSMLSTVLCDWDEIHDGQTEPATWIEPTPPSGK